MKAKALFLLAVFAAAPVMAGEWQPMKATPAMEQESKDAVRGQLRDPASATFSGLRGARMPDGTPGICGFVNAKNGFGGYGGDTPFFVFLAEASPASGKKWVGAAFIAEQDRNGLAAFYETFPGCGQ